MIDGMTSIDKAGVFSMASSSTSTTGGYQIAAWAQLRMSSCKESQLGIWFC